MSHFVKGVLDVVLFKNSSNFQVVKFDLFPQYEKKGKVTYSYSHGKVFLFMSVIPPTATHAQVPLMR